MMILLKLDIPPVAKQRPRFFLRNGRIDSATPLKTTAFESTVRYQARTKIRTPMTGPVKLELFFRIPKPERRALKNRVHPAVRPDLDNYIKAVKDALNKVAYLDDGQVCRIFAEKQYAAADERPGLTITIEELE